MSRICSELDASWRRFGPARWATSSSPACSSTRTYIEGRVDGPVVSPAAAVATGITRNGDREVLGCDVGDSETRACSGPRSDVQRRVSHDPFRSTRDSPSPISTPTGRGWRWCASPPISSAGSSCCACAARLANAEPKTLRWQLWHTPARVVRHARRDHRAHPRRLAHVRRGARRLPPHRAHRLIPIRP